MARGGARGFFVGFRGRGEAFFWCSQGGQTFFFCLPDLEAKQSIRLQDRNHCINMIHSPSHSYNQSLTQIHSHIYSVSLSLYYSQSQNNSLSYSRLIDFNILLQIKP